jgi:hypothetical protein
MDKLQSEYEALQQKLALLKRDSSLRGAAGTPLGGAGGPAATPLGVAGGSSAARAAGAEPRPLQVSQPAAAALTPVRTTGKAALSSTPLGAGVRASAPLSENRAPSLQAPLPPTATTAAAAGSSALRAVGTTAGASAAAAAAAAADSSGLGLSSDGASALAAIHFSDRHSGSALCAAAAASFEDPEFVKLCEQAMCQQLQRTKEGATAHSRILELAGGLAGHLARCAADVALAATPFNACLCGANPGLDAAQTR